MDLEIKLAVLDEIYQIYHGVINKLSLACRKYCDHCCTVNVTLTSLEAHRILCGLKKTGRKSPVRSWPPLSEQPRFQPEFTTNRLAEICRENPDMTDSRIPEAIHETSSEKCPLLEEHACSIYDFRPFGCRCMVSKSNCGDTGYADMADWIVSVNTVFMQYIEHIDADGFSGNLIDLLIHMNSDENRRQYRKNSSNTDNTPLISNQQIPVLMIPPEQMDRLSPIINALNNINISR